MFRKLGFRNFGYQLQLYSLFLMDLYTNSSVIAYTDTDAPFILPVGHSSIFSKEGRLKVIGIRTTFKYSWYKQWYTSTEYFLGLPMVFDYMSYFPVYLYPSTLKNCREFVRDKFSANVTKGLKVNTFEEAFLKGSSQRQLVSSVNVMLTYAFFYERDRYDWHLDIGETDTLATINGKFSSTLKSSPLLPKDIEVKPHDTLHGTYYRKALHHPLELAICFFAKQDGKEKHKDLFQISW